MGNANLVLKESIVKEPDFKASNQEIGETNTKCPTKEDPTVGEEKIPKINTSYYIDNKGVKLEKITHEKEIILVIETQNMVGEDIIIELPFSDGFCKFEDREVTTNHVLKVNVSGNQIKIKLDLII